MTPIETRVRQLSISTRLGDYLLPAVMMGSLGLFYWAIRGTGDYGGSMGGAFAGLGWAICWQFFSRDGKPRPYANGWTILAIVIGMAVGGMHGYGQFNGWVNGSWEIAEGVEMPVDAFWGYMGHLQCGIAWGGTTGVLVAWTRSGPSATRNEWLGRVVFGAAGAIICVLLVVAFPALVLPLYDTGIYSISQFTRQCTRAYETAINAAILLGLFAGFIVHLIVKRDWPGVKAAAIMGAGFGFAFTFSAFLFLNDDIFGRLLWKPWEMSIGLMGGASVGIAWTAINKPVDIDTKVIESRVHFPSEKLGGENLTLLIALGISIWNGIVGIENAMIGNLFAADPVASAMITILTTGCIVGLSVAFVLSIVRFKKGLPSTCIGIPAIKFAAVQAILIVVGFLTSLYLVMSAEVIQRLWTYLLFVVIGIASFLVTMRLKRLS